MLAEDQQDQQLTQKRDDNRIIVYALMVTALGLVVAYIAIPFVGLEAPKDLITIVGTIVGILGGVLKGSN